jgi:hypothetical protein
MLRYSDASAVFDCATRTAPFMAVLTRFGVFLNIEEIKKEKI